ncbi:unnamed protein product [Zymoseptoria tritici ST99CH_1E4]|uniref:Uncharacterized protein n=1 Tax=Zymoseptoria tritici ST99CH_1E4 TaxID=1276532 RepID=A0A2H1FZP7_ZYMTR|nr:unnamed protein product [Zymoseptoria tritici ST99CH_1E4]
MSEIQSDGAESNYEATQYSNAEWEGNITARERDALGSSQITNTKRRRTSAIYLEESQPPSSPAPIDPPHLVDYYQKCCNARHVSNMPYSTRDNTFRTTTQNEMLLAYDKCIAALAERIQLEDNSPSIGSSRLINRPLNDISTLIMQLEGEVLRSILCNTFHTEAEEALQQDDEWTLHSPDQGISDVDECECDPGIYVNVFAPIAGGGLNREQAELFVLACQTLSGNGDISDNRLRQHGIGVGVGVKYHYKKLTGLDFDGMTKDQRDKMKKDLNLFALLWKARLKNASKGIEHFSVCIEGGWTIDLLTRLNAHFVGRNSPIMFSIVRSLLLHLFPQLKFTLRQYVVLRPFFPKDAAIGESIVHQMFSTYLAAGGCNTVQAGGSVVSSGKLTDEVRVALEKRAEETGLMRLWEANAKEEMARIRAIRNAIVVEEEVALQTQLNKNEPGLQEKERVLERLLVVGGEAERLEAINQAGENDEDGGA